VTVQYCIYRMRISMLYYLKQDNKGYTSSGLYFENIKKYDSGVTQ
jgi:hypothetical protein